MSALRCNCCGRVITGATYDAAHTYRLPVYELVRAGGQLAALRVGTRRAAVCGPCVARIHAAAARRRNPTKTDRLVRNRPQPSERAGQAHAGTA